MIRSADRTVRPPVAVRAVVRGAPWRLLVSAGTRTSTVAALGLLAASLVFYYPLVFLGRALVDYDAFVFFYPQRVYLARSLLAGHLPLWDPYLFMGAPFLANPQTAVLYPPSWLFVFGPVETAYSLQLVLHGFLAAFFTYLFVRRAFQVAPLAAALGGLAYAFGGFAVGQVGHLNQISAAAWLPAVLLAYDRFTATRHVRFVALGALALALQLLAGHPQETYMSLIVLGLYGLVRAPWREPRNLVVNGMAGIALCALGGVVAAAQLLPTLELAPLSIRGAGVNWRDAVAGSLPSYLAVRALFPPYWIQVPYTEYLGYAGVVPVALGFLALLAGRGRAVLFGGLVCFLGVFLALGEYNVFYGWIFDHVPGFDTFRVPARWLLVWEFGVGVLAALGADWIGRGSRIYLRQRSLWPRVVLVVVLLVIGLAWQTYNGEPFAQRRTPFVFAALAAAAVAAGALPHLGRSTLALGAVLVLTAGELFAASSESPARLAPPAAFTDGESVEWLQAHGVNEGDRLLSIARPEYVPASENDVRIQLSSLPSALVDSVLVAQKWHDTLTPNVPLQFGLNTADGYDGGVLPLLRWLRLSGVLVSDPRPDGVLLTRLEQVPSDRQLDLLGVRYVIANAGTPTPAGIQAIDFGDLRLFARPSTVPRTLVVFSASVEPDDDAALRQLARPDFDSNHVVVLNSGAQLSSATPAQAVVPDVQQPERWHAHVSLSQSGILLQREAWYPGWRARVDGVETPLVRADVLFRALPLSAGDHDVEIYLDSPAFDRGALASLLGLVAVALVLLWPMVGPRLSGTRRA